ncbi:MAG: SURF1 family protein, partial [Anaerolineales bacterium]
TADDYQRVVLEGTFLPQYEILLKNRPLDEVAGFHLVTPLQIDDGTVILVDRGWVPYEQGSRFDLEGYRYERPVRLQGILHPSQAEPGWKFLADPIPGPGEPPLLAWRVLHIEGIQRQIPLPLHPKFVILNEIEPATTPMPIPDFQLDLTNGPHLSYAIQWFSFAAISLIGGVAILRRVRLKQT